MILDQFGKPIRALDIALSVAHRFMANEGVEILKAGAIRQRVRELRHSILGYQSQEGQTIRVRPPLRYRNS